MLKLHLRLHVTFFNDISDSTSCYSVYELAKVFNGASEIVYADSNGDPFMLRPGPEVIKLFFHA